MQLHRLLIIGLAALLAFGIVAVAPAAAEEHPACDGDKAVISSEGTDVGGELTGSKYFTKPACTADKGKPDFQYHEPDDVLSVPESTVLGCHETARANSANFADDDC